MQKRKKVKAKVNEVLFLNDDGSSFIYKEIKEKNKLRNFIATETGEFESLDPEKMIALLSNCIFMKEIFVIGHI
jgi:hypothetical protein